MNKIIKKLSFSLPWDQRIAEIISKPFIFFNIHPNIVTIIGVLLGLTASFLYTTGDIFYAKIASIIFFFAACFDHVDGEVARKLNKRSIFGHYLDHIGVCISYIVLFRLTTFTIFAAGRPSSAPYFLILEPSISVTPFWVPIHILSWSSFSTSKI